MDAFLWLFLLSITMFIGSFLAGSIPLAFHLSEDRLRTISAFGIGLLVGAALIVIIPEGIGTLYSVPTTIPEINSNDFSQNKIIDITGDDMLDKRNKIESEDTTTPTISDNTTHVHSHTRVSVVSLTELRSLSSGGGGDREEDDHEIVGSSTIHKKPASATIGLVIHAAADGIALGASASEPALEIIVFLAIMLHKAPSAFGLSTVLLREGYNRRQIRKHLSIFALAAPLSALLTYSFLQRNSELDPIGMKWWTAMLLLFSGGTFLYVAMHVMQDVTSGIKDSGISGGHNVNKLSKSHVGFMLLGMFLPLLLQFEHSH
ncbi:6180_t:CDS:2 [Diversispora eburnea]|uniref:6180_t:CDS:1 n=1 Tax=Diversispora eburnea TaxID=1213867 RepID=A0A9N9AI38_9GLOM|nr:6180_t:CDS:2 [Diversispora eburnea]